MRYKWFLLVFLFVTFFLEQGTRQIYSAVLPQIKLDFLEYGVNDTQLGMVGTVFGAVFGLSLVGSGLAADFIGRKRVLVFGTLLFSIGVLGSGFAAGLGMMVVCYGIINAIGQCCIAPPCYSLISQYHDVSTRSTAMGIFQSAVYSGIVLSSVAAGWLADFGTGGWRRAFWIFGGIGIVWALAMQFGMKNTPQPTSPDDGKVSVKEAFMALLGKPTAILIAVAFGMFMYVSFGIRIWMIPFIGREFGCSAASAAFHGVFWHNLGAFVGMMTTARLIDRFGRNRPSVRLEVSALGFVLCAFPMVWVSKATGMAECCVALLSLGLAIGVYEAAHYPAMFDCIAPRYRSATTGLTGCMAFLFGSLAPIVLGWMSDHLTMRAGLMSLSFFFFAGALILVPAMLVFFKRDYIRQDVTA